MNKHARPSIIFPFLVVFTIALWASAFVGIRYAVESYQPGSLALLRYLIASVCMIVIWKKNPGPTAIRKQDILPLLLTGILGIALYNITLNHAEISISAGEASFMVAQTPVLNAVLAVLFLGEISRKQLWIGLVISAIGVIIIARSNLHHFAINEGFWFILTATFCSSLYTIVQKPLVGRIQPIRCACFAIWIGTIVLLIYTPQLIHDIQYASLKATLSVVYLGIFPAAIAYALWSHLLSKLSATKTSMTLYLSPVFTIILGWLFLRETPASLALLGGAIALTGAFITNRRPRGKASPTLYPVKVRQNKQG